MVQTAERDRRRPTLQEILRIQNGHESVHYRGGFIDLSGPNVLPQGRKTFVDIDILAEDIAAKNLLNPPLVARLNQESAEKYLAAINAIWNTEFKVDDLHHVNEEGEGQYYILIAGERRYRACKTLEDHACSDCAKKFGEEGCFSRHFPKGLEVRVCDNISPVEAVFRQASENTYMSIPPHEEAQYYDALMRAVRSANPDYSLTQFARDVGRGVEKVRDAMRFCKLPPEIQDYVREGRITYGVAVEIGRLVEANAPLGDIDYYITSLLGGRVTAQEFSKTVSKYLFNPVLDRNTLFDLEVDEDLKRGNIKWIVERETIKAIWSWIYYFKRVISLFNEGLLGNQDSPFSSASPLRVYKTLISTQTSLLPHLRSLISQKEFDQLQAELNAQTETVDRVIELTPENS